LEQLVSSLSPARFAPGETILKRWENPGFLYLIADGVIEELDANGVVAQYSRGDAFDPKALIEGRSHTSFTARSAATCYLLPAQPFLALTRTHRAIRDFYASEMARRTDALIAVQQQREAASLLLARIGDGTLHPPIFVSPATTIREAAQTMEDHGTSAVLVQFNDGPGIFTNRDVRERSTLMGMPDETPIGDLASRNLVTLERDDFLFNALLVMTKHSIRHVVITHGHEILGILEQTDLISYLSNQSYFIANQIERAGSPEELRDSAQSIHRMIRSLNERGVRPRYIARLVTDLNRKVFRKLAHQIFGEALIPDICLIVMGSEGRGEQLLRTDQDNALIIRDGVVIDDLAERTQAFTDALLDMGYPRCPGDVMVSNPAWAKPLAAFRKDIAKWTGHPDPTDLLTMAIFVDSSAVAGDEGLLGDLRGYMFERVRIKNDLIGFFAKAMLSFPTPLGMFGRFITEKLPPHAHKLDIKKGGIFPIVHGVRSLSLEQKIVETNTIARIQLLSSRGRLGEDFTADLIEAFDFLTVLRLRQQLKAWEGGEPYDNYIDPRPLNKFERNLLRDSLKIVKEFKDNITHQFHLNMLS
jgi:CBS domain-containing protein